MLLIVLYPRIPNLREKIGTEFAPQNSLQFAFAFLILSVA